MKKLSNIFAAAVLAVSISSSVGVSLAYAVSDDTYVDYQATSLSQDVSGENSVQSLLTANNDTPLANYALTTGENGTLDGQNTVTYPDTNTAMTGSGSAETTPVQPAPSGVPEPASPQSDLQVANGPSDDELQPAAGRPTIAIIGEVPAGTASVTVEVANTNTLSTWAIKLRVFDSDGSSNPADVGELAFTGPGTEEPYQYTIACDYAKMIQNKILKAFIYSGGNPISAVDPAETAISAPNIEYPTVDWDSDVTRSIDVLTNQIGVVFTVGTTGTPRTYEVRVSSTNKFIDDTDPEHLLPLGTILSRYVVNENGAYELATENGGKNVGPITQDGPVTIPITLGAQFINQYISVVLSAPLYAGSGSTYYAAAEGKRILGADDTASVSLSYDDEGKSYILTGGVNHNSRPEDEYVYTWYKTNSNSNDAVLGTERTLSGQPESILNDVYLLVSVKVPAAFQGTTLSPCYVSATAPAWPNAAAVIAESPAAGTVTASWSAVGRVFSPASVQVAASSYEVQLMNGAESVATQTVTGTEVSFTDVPEGAYRVVVIPKNENTADGGELSSSEIEVRGNNDDPVIIDPDEPIVYVVTSDDIWVKGSEEGMVFHGEGSMATFTGATLDNVELGESLYTVTSGSTVLTLAASYLETLSAGNHTLGMQWDDGAGSKTFKVQAASSDEPDPDPVVDPTDDSKKEEAQPEQPIKEETQPAAETKPAPAATQQLDTQISTASASTMPQTSDSLIEILALLMLVVVVSLSLITWSIREK